ncbi:hypothetical protein [Deinococcus radiotolerans]|uniref:Lipoprotein n=1 Tax=Deinococcus radiotolerans TaxID=1309407 RepID=A0ABQ2FJ32_9DEIO|nr:hypothetical protein [Deinococcus radiotolerans]GGK97029.1 hypothetical protein GCM10010844_14260 [Deinococcus radiotolerans]
MKRTTALLTVTTLLLAACKPTPTPTNPAQTEPAAPVVGQSLDVQDVMGTAQSAAKQLVAMTDPNSPNMDADLKPLLGLLGMGSAPVRPNSLDLSGAASFGKTFVQGLGGHGRVTTQAMAAVQEALATGTHTYTRNGGYQYSELPRDGYVQIDEQSGVRIETSWKVGGAPTVWVNNGYTYDSNTGQVLPLQQEVPTNATGSVTVSGKTVAGLKFSMTPGDCLNTAGPTALTLSGWAGRETNAPAKLDLTYAWTEKDVLLSGSALYATTREKVAASMKLNVTGTTSDRCGNAFTFTPTRADLTGMLDIPSHKTELNVYLRDLSNLEFSEKAMSAPNALDKIGGTVNAALTFNGKAVVTAFGPLADGKDMDLQPGDQVKFRYVKSGKLIETDFRTAEKDMQELANPRR